MNQLKFLRCSSCGKIIVVLNDSSCETMCCGKPMVQLEANTADAAAEKHVPVVTREGNKLTVQVGSLEHPMTEQHYIEFVALQTANGFRIAKLHPGDHPSVDFLENEKVTAVYAYCNLHGLWKTEA